jgi:hypothetical protein
LDARDIRRCTRCERWVTIAEMSARSGVCKECNETPRTPVEPEVSRSIEPGACSICEKQISDGDRGIAPGVCCDCEKFKPVPIRWQGHTVGHILDPQQETVTSVSSKLHGRWTPDVRSPALRAFMQRLEEAEQSPSELGRVRVTAAGSSQKAWFSLDPRNEDDAWLYSHWSFERSDPS